jgi:hypothetical protein
MIIISIDILYIKLILVAVESIESHENLGQHEQN